MQTVLFFLLIIQNSTLQKKKRILSITDKVNDYLNKNRFLIIPTAIQGLKTSLSPSSRIYLKGKRVLLS
jgi:hypothetical protein